MARNRDSQLYKGLAELAVLAALNRRTQYGLELLSEITDRAGLKLGEGTIYPLLHRLEKEQLIVAEWKLNTPNGRPRKYYKLTKKGRDVLSGMAVTWRSMRQKLDAFLEEKIQ